MNSALLDEFATITDPRVERTQRHPLLNVIGIAICAVVSGADSWVEVEAFGHAKQAWLSGFLDLANGIPSHDTFGDVFARLDPTEFEASFMSWVAAIYERSGGQVIALDGKTVRRSHNQTLGKRAIHMVSAWASANRLVLGQLAVEEKSNELTAIPELLRLLDVSGCIVTIDAMGCHANIASDIVDGGGDYLLALKDNQPTLAQDVRELFEYAHARHFREFNASHARTVSKDHGRLETRECVVLTDPDGFPALRTTAAWPRLTSLVMVRRQRSPTTPAELAFYISSLAADADRILDASRAHWSIENSCHWVLDVAFREDDSRVRSGHAPHNLAVLRHIALNLLKANTAAKGGVHAKRLRAAWDETFLFELLFT